MEDCVSDLLSKYQFHNSNLQYENYYLKEQNKYLEKEIKNRRVIFASVYGIYFKKLNY